MVLMFCVYVNSINEITWTRIVPKGLIKPKGRMGHLFLKLPGSTFLLYGGSDIETGLPIDDGGVYYYDYNKNKWNIKAGSEESPGPLPKTGFCYWKGLASDQFMIFVDKEFWQYSFQSNTWQQIIPIGVNELLPEGGLRYATCSRRGSASNDVIIWGGYLNTGHGLEISNTTFLYSMSSNELYVDETQNPVDWMGRHTSLLYGPRASSLIGFPGDMYNSFHLNTLNLVWTTRVLSVPIINPSISEADKGKYFFFGGLYKENNTITNNLYYYNSYDETVTQIYSTRGIAPHLIEHKMVQYGTQIVVFGGYLLQRDDFTNVEEKIPDNDLWMINVIY